MIQREQATFAAVMVLVLAGVTHAQAPAASDGQLDVAFQPARKFFEPDGPLEVLVVMQNRSTVPVPTAGIVLDDQMEVTDRSGKPIEKKQLLESEGAKLPETIAPGARLDRTIDLRHAYPGLAEPGCYHVRWNNPKIHSRAPELRVAPHYDPKAEHVVTMETTMGSVTFALLGAEASNHVFNFVQLAASGFYDGLTFHRVIDGFMIQGGDPNGDGTGSAGYQVQAELGDLKHETGSLAMARGPDVNSASCQFYVCLSPQPRLDGQYTVFGKVVEGMDVVTAIGKVKTGSNDRPVEPVVIEKMTVSTVAKPAAAPATSSTMPTKPATP